MFLPVDALNARTNLSASTQRQSHDALLHIATAITGLIAAISYLALGHVFTANMTGNVVFVAFAVAGVPGLSLTRSIGTLLLRRSLVWPLATATFLSICCVAISMKQRDVSARIATR
jgi:uncharacterized membrane protein YoaK (UPF0700 family)